MKKQILAATTALLLCMLLLTGCLKDSCSHTYKIFTPVYKSLSELRAAVRAENATPLTGTFKLYISGDRIYLSEKDKGIHIIDNSNPAQPKNTAFINIPGHADVVVKGNMMYADLYCDLAAIELTGTKDIKVKKYITNLFPYRLDYNNTSTNPDSIRVIVDWKSRDTVISCGQATAWRNCPSCNMFPVPTAQSAGGGKSADGTGGSMARFASVNNYLYTVTSQQLNIVDLANPADPVALKTQNAGSNIETIYPFKDKLFLGSGTGMFVYDIQDPVNPKITAWRGHWKICDPVIADDNYAYVTLFDGAVCSGTINQMEVYSLADINNPTLVKTYPFTNPHGLAKDGNLLFVCDGRDGLKVFDAANAVDIKPLSSFSGINAYDVVALNGIAYVSAKNGLYQYDYSDRNNIHLLSKLDWKK